MMHISLPFEPYYALSDADCFDKIHAVKAALGSELLILGHYYQRDEVYQFADRTGDSLQLSFEAAKTDAKYIVFCGVHFMAEVADIVTRPEQIVVLPDKAAGCSMADMANRANVETCWRQLSELGLNPAETVMPVTYINSAADLKAFCGREGGTICTSSNARAILDWALSQREKVLFFPDQHLGRNTAYAMGIPLEEMAVWNFRKPMGGLSTEEIRRAKILLWDGWCSVHQRFEPAHIDDYLEKYPDTKIIAHPEARFDVCQRADYIGSTAFILETIRDAAPNTRWLVATELNLVNRLHQQYKGQGKIVDFMAPTVSMCSTMFRTDPQHLAWVLDNLARGYVTNRIQVHPSIAEDARVALDRMFAITRQAKR